LLIDYFFLAVAQPQDAGHWQLGPHVQTGPQQHSPFFGTWLPHLHDAPQFSQPHDFVSLMVRFLVMALNLGVRGC
jgi:hypothetical protein